MIELFSIPSDYDDTEIRQFNLDPDVELKEMYSRPKPDDYVVVVTLFYRDEEGRDSASQLLEELLTEGLVTSIPKYELTQNAKTCFNLQELPAYFEDVMSPEQQAWWHRGVYIQCGFWCPSRADDMSLLRGISVAMIWYDSTVKPYSIHQAIRAEVRAFEAKYLGDSIPVVIARNYRLVVGDIFRERVGFWSRDVLMARNEILTKVRARLAGTDPQKEWERFKGSGMKYYLDLEPASS